MNDKTATKYTYVEVVRFKGLKTVHRIDVTGKTDREYERIERGLNINLNHKEYYTCTDSYDEPQPLNPA